MLQCVVVCNSFVWSSSSNGRTVKGAECASVHHVLELMWVLVSSTSECALGTLSYEVCLEVSTCVAEGVEGGGWK